MTNKEILHASLLDIVFDNRNKEYGAYALRREYNNRLLISLGAGLSVVLFFVLFNVLAQKDSPVLVNPFDTEGTIVTVEPLTDIHKKPEPPKEQPRSKPAQQPAEKIAKVDFQTIAIVPDEQVIQSLATQTDIDGKQISNQNAAGNVADDIVKNEAKPVGDRGNGIEPSTAQVDFAPSYSDPEYPGGQEALSRFLSQNLATPDDLDTGEKKMVKIRFKVDKDGTVTGFVIDQTGGEVFDKEVIRVCKKMRRWKPALQNGAAVAVSYVLLVTFIGIEQ